jgi:hypothetical protein
MGPYIWAAHRGPTTETEYVTGQHYESTSENKHNLVLCIPTGWDGLTVTFWSHGLSLVAQRGPFLTANLSTGCLLSLGNGTPYKGRPPTGSDHRNGICDGLHNESTSEPKHTRVLYTNSIGRAHCRILVAQRGPFMTANLSTVVLLSLGNGPYICAAHKGPTRETEYVTGLYYESTSENKHNLVLCIPTG